MPAADLKFYQDQARELDDLTARISNIARGQPKVAGVYNSAADGVQRVMNEGVENQQCRWRTGARSATAAA